MFLSKAQNAAVEGGLKVYSISFPKKMPGLKKLKRSFAAMVKSSINHEDGKLKFISTLFGKENRLYIGHYVPYGHGVWERLKSLPFPSPNRD